jgi:hypothetical protein
MAGYLMVGLRDALQISRADLTGSRAGERPDAEVQAGVSRS